MAASEGILDILEERARRFEFPVLDNANAQFIAGRFRGFRRRGDWGLLFELLVFAPQERAIVTDVYAYGPLIGDNDWALVQVGGIDEVAESPLWDENGYWISRPGARLISVGGERLEASCGPHGVGAIHLDMEECQNEVRFTKAIVRHVGIERLVPKNVAFDRLPGFALAQEVFSLVNWDHPDVAGGETPRDSKAIVAASRLVSGEAQELAYDHFWDNLDDPRWAEGDS